jgi:hypothetical protein
MEPDEIKQLVANAAEARATRNFSPLIRVERVRAEPIVIDRDRFLRVSDGKETAANYIRETHRVEGYLGSLAPLLFQTILPREAGGAGFVLAGGALHHALLTRSVYHDFRYASQHGKSDLDFFPVGLNQAQADLLVRRFISLMQCFAEDDAAFLARIRGCPEWAGTNHAALLDLHALIVGDDLLTMGIYRTPNAVTVTLCGHTIQLVTRLYPSREAVVRDFDLAPAQFLWDGFQVWTTELGALAYSTGCFPLELDHCLAPTTYARRLHKYLMRGYTLLLLDADVEKLTEHFFLPGLGCFVTRARNDPLHYIAQSLTFNETPDDEQDFWPLRDEVTTRMDGTERDLEHDVKSEYPEVGDQGAILPYHGQYRYPIYDLVGTEFAFPIYLYRAMDYDIVSCFIGNMLALLRERAERGEGYGTGQREWRDDEGGAAQATTGASHDQRESQQPEGARRSEAGWRVDYLTQDPPFRWRVCNGGGDAINDYVESQIGMVIARLDWPEYRWLREPLRAISPDLNPAQIRGYFHETLLGEEAPQEIEWSYGPPSGKPVDPDAWYGPIADYSWRAKAARR